MQSQVKTRVDVRSTRYLMFDEDFEGGGNGITVKAKAKFLSTSEAGVTIGPGGGGGGGGGFCLACENIGRRLHHAFHPPALFSSFF